MQYKLHMVKSQVVVGVVFMIAGILLSLTIIGAIYGIPLFLVGVFLLIFRNEEDKIEKIKEVKNK